MDKKSLFKDRWNIFSKSQDTPYKQWIEIGFSWAYDWCYQSVTESNRRAERAENDFIKLNKRYLEMINIKNKQLKNEYKKVDRLTREIEHAIKYMESCGYIKLEFADTPEYQMLENFKKVLNEVK